MRFALVRTAVPILLLLSATASPHGPDDGFLGERFHAVGARLDEIGQSLFDKRQTRSVRLRSKAAFRARAILAAAEEAETAGEQARLASLVAQIAEAKFGNDRELTATLRRLSTGFDELVHDALRELGTVAAKNGVRRLRRRIRAYHHRADLAPRSTVRLRWNARALRVAKVAAFGDDQSALLVISALGLSETGVDVDGDGDADNSLSQILAAADELGLDLDVDGLLAQLIDTSPLVTLLQLWSIDSFTDDPFVEIGVMVGLDTDGDTGDNASGTEEFAVSPLLLGDDGFPLARTVTWLESAEFSVEVDPSDFDLGGAELPLTTVVRMVGRLTADGAEGQIGIAVPLELLAALIEAAADGGVGALPPLGPLLALAADVDTDGDGANDALALVIDFEAVPATRSDAF